jgi:DNA-binding NarL/FixJ family response regulator
MPVKVIIVDDHAIIRDGLQFILAAQDDIVVIGTAANGRSAIIQAETHKPDVIIMDVSMPELNGIEASQIIRDRFPAIKIIMLSMHHTNEHVHRALVAGARGYLLKESAGTEVVSAIRAVMRGHRYFSEGIAAVAEVVNPVVAGKSKSPLDSLSQREREVLQLVVEGKTSVEIAETLSLSPKSVETYRSRLMLKLGIENIPALVKFAVQYGITPAT